MQHFCRNSSNPFLQRTLYIMRHGSKPILGQSQVAPCRPCIHWGAAQSAKKAVQKIWDLHTFRTLAASGSMRQLEALQPWGMIVQGCTGFKLHGWDSGLPCCSWLASFRQTKEAKAVSIPKISSFLSLLSRESLRKTDSGGETSAKATRCAYLSSMFYADIRRISKHHSNLKTTFVQLYGLWLHGFMVERCKSFCSATFGLVQGKEDMVCIYTYICSTIYIKL